jgi:hypothetical protein
MLDDSLWADGHVFDVFWVAEHEHDDVGFLGEFARGEPGGAGG